MRRLHAIAERSRRIGRTKSAIEPASISQPANHWLSPSSPGALAALRKAGQQLHLLVVEIASALPSWFGSIALTAAGRSEVVTETLRTRVDWAIVAKSDSRSGVGA